MSAVNQSFRLVEMLLPPKILDGVAAFAEVADGRGFDHGLAVAAGDIEDVGRLGEAGDAAAQAFDQRLSVGDRNAEMRSAGREVRVVQVIRPDTSFDEGAHQLGEHVGIVVDALEQHRLAQQCHTGVGETGYRRPCG